MFSSNPAELKIYADTNHFSTAAIANLSLKHSDMTYSKNNDIGLSKENILLLYLNILFSQSINHNRKSIFLCIISKTIKNVFRKNVSIAI